MVLVPGESVPVFRDLDGRLSYSVAGLYHPKVRDQIGLLMKSHYRLMLSFLLFPMAFGYNPVTDTLKEILEIDALYGTADYYSGCESPRQDMAFEEVHVGLKSRTGERSTLHIDGGIFRSQVKPLPPYGGKTEISWYGFGGFDFDWKYAGLGVNVPLLDPYFRLGPKSILYADIGIAHKFPISSSGLITMGLGSGFGTDNFNLWIGSGSGNLVGSMGEFKGYSLSGEYRLCYRFWTRFGGLVGEGRTKSAWIGVRMDFK